MWFLGSQEAERLLSAARKEGTGWVRVDKELISKIDTALDKIRLSLTKAERENSSLYFQVSASCHQPKQHVALLQYMYVLEQCALPGKLYKSMCVSPF